MSSYATTTCTYGNPLIDSVTGGVVTLVKPTATNQAFQFATSTCVEVRDTPTQVVSGSVSVNNFPATQAVTGTFWQSVQPVSGTVAVSTAPATQVFGSVGVSSIPATQVFGSVGVNNFPAIQNVNVLNNASSTGGGTTTIIVQPATTTQASSTSILNGFTYGELMTSSLLLFICLMMFFGGIINQVSGVKNRARNTRNAKIK